MLPYEISKKEYEDMGSKICVGDYSYPAKRIEVEYSTKNGEIVEKDEQTKNN